MLGWWQMPGPVEAQAQAVSEGWRHWKTLHLEHKRTAKTRAFISLAVGFAAAFAIRLILLWSYAREAFAGLALAGLLAAARFGRPEGVRIVGQAHVPAQFEKLTQDGVTEALGSIGVSGIDKFLREGGQLRYPNPVRQHGPGWRAEVELPRRVTATQRIARRAPL